MDRRLTTEEFEGLKQHYKDKEEVADIHALISTIEYGFMDDEENAPLHMTKKEANQFLNKALSQIVEGLSKEN